LARLENLVLLDRVVLVAIAVHAVSLVPRDHKAHPAKKAIVANQESAGLPVRKAGLVRKVCPVLSVNLETQEHLERQANKVLAALSANEAPLGSWVPQENVVRWARRALPVQLVRRVRRASRVPRALRVRPADRDCPALLECPVTAALEVPRASVVSKANAAQWALKALLESAVLQAFRVLSVNQEYPVARAFEVTLEIVAIRVLEAMSESKVLRETSVAPVFQAVPVSKVRKE